MSYVRIVPAAEFYSDSYCDLLDRVAKERQYLAMTHGFSRESTRDFVRNCIANHLPQFFAVDDQDQVVGWCDITRGTRELSAHVGTLGIGVDPDYRGQGLGGRLLQAALERARQAGLEKIELEVLASNRRAYHLYQKFGFHDEGCREGSIRIDGRSEDILLMAKWL